METQVIKSINAITIKVTWHAAVLDRDVDGDICGTDVVSVPGKIIIEKDGKEIIVANEGFNSLSEDYPGMPEGAAGVIKAGSRVLPLNKAVFDLIKDALTEAKEKAEAEYEVEENPEDEMIVNPQYANISREEIKKAEAEYDAIHNEGGEGFNPYRDNLMISSKEIQI